LPLPTVAITVINLFSTLQISVPELPTRTSTAPVRTFLILGPNCRI
jgi:hypothetical protein